MKIVKMVNNAIDQAWTAAVTAKRENRPADYSKNFNTVMDLIYMVTITFEEI